MQKIFVFDLDQTLYPKQSNIIKQIDCKITDFCQRLFNYNFEQADKIREEYFHTYGTTLAGLMDKQKISPFEYLDYVHDVDYSQLVACSLLEATLSKIEKKIIFTNGNFDHAKRVLKQRKLDHLFDDYNIYDICKGNFISKPHIDSFKNFLEFYNLSANEIIFFDDSLANIKTARSLGIESWHVFEGEMIEFCTTSQITSSLAKDIALILDNHKDDISDHNSHGIK